MTLVLCVVLVALIFEYINGFHDTANAIATSVATKVMTAGQAIILSTICNLIGALIGVAVAKTVGKGLVDTHYMTLAALLCALTGAIVWNLITWYVGLPSSSSHGLVGGMCGAVLASSHGKWSSMIWYTHTAIDPVTQQTVELSFWKSQGLWPKVICPMIVAPVLGFVIGLVIMGVLYTLLRNWRPRTVSRVFGKVQIASAAWMSIGHGMNDAQKTMGIIALTLFTATTKGDAFANLPSWLSFLSLPKFDIPFWVKVACGLTMAAGTAAGGWRIIKTLGSSMVKLQPVHGFAAQTTAAMIIEGASHFGIPLSTTHVISSSIMGVGASKRFKAVKWMVAERMVWAWVMTLPITAAISYGLMRLVQAFALAE